MTRLPQIRVVIARVFHRDSSLIEIELFITEKDKPTALTGDSVRFDRVIRSLLFCSLPFTQ